MKYSAKSDHLPRRTKPNVGGFPIQKERLRLKTGDLDCSAPDQRKRTLCQRAATGCVELRNQVIRPGKIPHPLRPSDPGLACIVLNLRRIDFCDKSKLLARLLPCNQMD